MRTNFNIERIDYMSTNEKARDNPVIGFAQSTSTKKQFQPNQPVTDELLYEMIAEVFTDFCKGVINEHLPITEPILKEIIDDHFVSNNQEQTLIQNLFWWQILYQAHLEGGLDVFEEYILGNPVTFKGKPILKSWLREWKRAVPKFYFVGEKYSDRLFVVIDILTQELLEVNVYDPAAIPPKEGEIAVGILIPMGDGLYFPIIDFYHFDFKARDALAATLYDHFDKYLQNSSMLEAFIHVLSVALQIEKIISEERQSSM